MKRGRYKPGESGNLKGRPTGATNKISRPLKEKVAEFLNTAIDELPQIWSKLKPREKAQMIRDLLPYAIPKLQAVQMEADINFNSMSEDQLDSIANRLLTNINK